MTTQVLNLESFSTNNNLLTPNNALGSGTGTWTTNVDNSAWNVIGEFPTPNENQANGTHTFTARVRKDAGSNNPNFQMIVQDAAGNTLGDSGAVALTSTTGQDVTVQVSGAALQAGSGGLAGVRVSLIGSQTGGGPSARSVPQLDYVSWSGDFTAILSNPPVADAGSPQTVKHGDGTVNLNGTGSLDDVGIVTWAWVQTAGTDTVTLTGANTSTPSFNCDTLTPDVYTFQLTVTDADTQSDSASVNVTVTLSDAPVANAGNDQTVEPSGTGGGGQIAIASVTGRSVESGIATWSVDGPAIVDDGDLLLAYLLVDDTQTNVFGSTTTAPTSDDAFTNMHPNTALSAGGDMSGFLFKKIADPSDVAIGTPNTYSWSGMDLLPPKGQVIFVRVTGHNDVDLDSFVLTPAGSQSATVPGFSTTEDNELLIAFAGVDESSPGLTTYWLDAAGWNSELGAGTGNAQEGGSSTYSAVWSKSQASAGATGDMTFTIDATENDAIVAFVVAVKQAAGGSVIPVQVDLDGTSSTDDFAITAWLWEQLSGTTVTLVDETTSTPYFDAPTSEGDLVFQLTVTDADGQQDTDTITVHVVATPTGPQIYIYNGSSEVPATFKVFNGATEVAATIELAP